MERYNLWLILGFYAMLGAFARMSLNLLWYRTGFFYLSAFPSIFLLTNAVGCFFMGILVATKDTIFVRMPRLSAGLSSGFCGSLTTFSGWMIASSAALVSTQLVNWILELAVGFILSFASVYLGYGIGTFCSQIFERWASETFIDEMNHRIHKRIVHNERVFHRSESMPLLPSSSSSSSSTLTSTIPRQSSYTSLPSTPRGCHTPPLSLSLSASSTFTSSSTAGGPLRHSCTSLPSTPRGCHTPSPLSPRTPVFARLSLAEIEYLESPGEDNWANEVEEAEQEEDEEEKECNNNNNNNYNNNNQQHCRATERKDTPLLSQQAGNVVTLGLIALMVVLVVGEVWMVFGGNSKWMRLGIALLSAPVGAILRHIVVSKNIALNPEGIPWFTFVVNILGTIGAGVLMTIYLRNTPPGSPPSVEFYIGEVLPGDWWSALPAVATGLCGCFTTVSTYMNEVRKLPLRTVAPYVCLTTTAGQIVAVSFFWLAFR